MAVFLIQDTSEQPPPVVGVEGRALEQDAGGRVEERPVGNVAVAGDPADVGRAPVDVIQLGEGQGGRDGQGDREATWASKLYLNVVAA